MHPANAATAAAIAAARIDFVVAGKPVPQGALVRAPQGHLYHRGAARLVDWRHAIGDEARKAMRGMAPFDGAVAIEAVFAMPRPKSHYNRHGLRADAPTWCTKQPDVDKLERALLDSLTGVAFMDDAQVVETSTRKVYAPWGMTLLGPGVVVSVSDGGAA